MGADTHTLALQPAIVASPAERVVPAPVRLGSAKVSSAARRITVTGAFAILGGSILVALAFPILVFALPLALVVRLVLSIVWARSRNRERSPAGQVRGTRA